MGGQEARGEVRQGAVRAREMRLVAVVEAFLRHVREGGGLDPEPFLRMAPELRGDLEPLLLGVLRLEASAEALERKSLDGG